MNLILTNKTSDLVLVSAGDWAEALQYNVPMTVSRPEDVMVIGDKPDVIDALKTAVTVFSALVKGLIDRLAGRRSSPTPPEVVEVEISNQGANPVRIILGDGVSDTELPAGATYLARSEGYVELRELGHAPQQDTTVTP